MMRRAGLTGFTLLEFLSILVLLGILSAVVFARLDVNPFRTISFEQELRSAVRFGQKFAIVSGCEVQVTVNAGGYALRVRDDADTDGCLAAGDGFGTFLRKPTGGEFNVTAPAGISIGGAAAFIFDRQGRTPSSQNFTIDTLTISVEAGSGYVH